MILASTFLRGIFHTIYHRNQNLLGVFDCPSDGGTDGVDIDFAEDTVDYDDEEEDKVPVMNVGEDFEISLYSWNQEADCRW